MRKSFGININLSEQELVLFDRYCQQIDRTQAEVIEDWIQSCLQASLLGLGELSSEKLVSAPLVSAELAPEHADSDQLCQEIASLRQEIKALKQENNRLKDELYTGIQPTGAQPHPDTQFPSVNGAAVKQWQVVLEAVPIPVAISRLTDGVILYANQAVRETFGISLSDLPHHTTLDFYQNEADRQRMLAHLVENGFIHDYEVRVQKANGQPFWVAVSIRPLPFNGERALLSVFFDITDRKHAEATLRHSQDELRVITDSVPAGVAYADAERRYRFVNKTYAQWVNQRREDIIGKPLWEVLGEKSYSQVRTYIDRVLAGEPVMFEADLPLPSGVRCIAARLVPDRGKQNQVKGYYALLTDITERKQAEEERDRFFDLSLDMLCIADFNGYFRRINPVWGNTLGYTEVELLSVPYLEFVHPDDRARTIAEAKNVTMGTDSIEFENRYRCRDGSYRWFLWNGKPIPDQGVIYCVVHDITARKQAEDALRMAEENYRSIFENALEGIFQASPDGYYLRVNPAMARIYGYGSPEQMMAVMSEIDDQIYIDPGCRYEFERLIHETGTVKDFQYQIRRQDGQPIWIEENTRAVRDPDGNLLYYEGIIEDITVRKREEEALKFQVQKLRIEIDHQKRQRDVAEIVQTEYFQELQVAVEHLRREE